MSDNFIKNNLEKVFNYSYNSLYVKTFIKFLHIKKLYAKFMYNLIICYIHNNEEVSKINSNILGPGGFILSSFPWWRTSEGNDFWNNAHCEWNEWLFEMYERKIHKPSSNKWYRWLKEKS